MLLNDREGEFERSLEGFGGLSQRSDGLLVVDLDGGGHEDLALATDESTALVTLSEAGPRLLGRLPGATRLAAIDFDRDDQLDLQLDTRLFRGSPEGVLFESRCSISLSSHSS